MDLPNERLVKREIYEQLAQFGKAFGSARRLQVIELLAQSEYSVEQLATESGMSFANTSQHLKVLRANRLVEVRRQGVEAFYRLSNETVFTVWEGIRSLAEDQIADIGKLAHRLHHDNPADFLSFGELAPGLHTGRFLLIDVRPESEYAAGHISGAVNIPLEKLAAQMPDTAQLGDAAQLGDIDREQDIIVYCRGPYSTLSGRAVQLLHAQGYRAKRLEKGFPQWRACALPVEKKPG